jgi:pimeloyl-ACP methyl ester carboxylesterase
MPEDRSAWPVRHVDADTVEILLSGVALPLTGPIRPHSDGRADSDFGTGLVLVDDEATAIAAITTDGRLEPLSEATANEWRAYAAAPSDVRERLAPGTRAILRDRPLTAAAEAALTGPVLVVAPDADADLPADLGLAAQRRMKKYGVPNRTKIWLY